MSENPKTNSFNPVGYHSKVSKEISLIRFCNISGSGASIIWLDFNGKRALYNHLSHGQYMDMNSFVSHPWVFEKTSTGDRLNGNSCETFFPQANGTRQVVNITYPMYSLKERSLQVIRDCLDLTQENDMTELELPKPLDGDLRFLKLKKNCAQIHSKQNEQNISHTCTFYQLFHRRFLQLRRLIE